jgi:hypothetical protein
MTTLYCIVFTVTVLVALEHALQQNPGSVCYRKYLSLLFIHVFVVCTVLPLNIFYGYLYWWVLWIGLFIVLTFPVVGVLLRTASVV